MSHRPRPLWSMLDFRPRPWPAEAALALGILALVIAIASAAANAAEPEWRPCLAPWVIDGDTLDCGIPAGPWGATQRERVRVVGVDTPEHRARCNAERAAAHQATARTEAVVQQAQSVALLGRPEAKDRYGRTLARVQVDGQDLAGILIAEGLGVPYAGGKRKDWCAGFTDPESR